MTVDADGGIDEFRHVDDGEESGCSGEAEDRIEGECANRLAEATVPWYQLNDANDPKLDELARQYNLHPLHLEDARSEDESVKVDTAPGYTFAVLKPVRLEPDPDHPGEQTPAFSAIDIFAGKDFLITISDPTCPTTAQALDRARRDGDDEHPGKLLYLILDTIVDLYFPAIDHFDDRIDDLEDAVFDNPSPEILQSIFAIKRELIDLRRVLVNTRDASLHLQRDPGTIIDSEHQPYVRDTYDHIARLLDSVETQRDLLNNTLDIYLSSVANRTNEVMKVLTVLGTIALPALAISGIYGMNLKGLPFEDSPHGAEWIAGITIVATALFLYLLRKFKWL